MSSRNYDSIVPGETVWVKFDKVFSRKTFKYEGPALIVSNNIRCCIVDGTMFYRRFVFRIPTTNKTISVLENAITFIRDI